eukprot:TRINITY_DN5315_c0_g2_i4.p4 TRINITY_DN5315_c0_g2~~TRINITY_DN5315_c0_g2_i4.p4  ORF type:complete len:103 (-),score=27.64 TRINITY_DN5315_c0_g2_i4:461-769(-)
MEDLLEQELRQLESRLRRQSLRQQQRQQEQQDYTQLSQQGLEQQEQQGRPQLEEQEQLEQQGDSRLLGRSWVWGRRVPSLRPKLLVLLPELSRLAQTLMELQ